jgi:hypothetical protein
MYFCPNFDNTTGYTTGADGWWYVFICLNSIASDRAYRDYWGPIVDCVFSWDAAWPARPGEQGSASQGSDEIDVAVFNAATQRGKAYNMRASVPNQILPLGSLLLQPSVRSSTRTPYVRFLL